MKKAIYRITLDVRSAVSQFTISAKKGDNARRLIISFTEGGTPYRLTDDCAAQLSVKRPNGELAFDSCIVTGGEVIYDFTRCVTRYAGRHECELFIYNSEGAQLTSSRFDIVTFSGVGSDAETEEGEDYRTLSEIVKDARYLDEAARYLNDNLGRIESAVRATAEWKAATYGCKEITLNSEDWNDENYQEVNVIGLGADNTVIVSPGTDHQAEYVNCGIQCVRQEENILTFNCKIKPSEDIKVNILMFGGQTEVEGK